MNPSELAQIYTMKFRKQQRQRSWPRILMALSRIRWSSQEDRFQSGRGILCQQMFNKSECIFLARPRTLRFAFGRQDFQNLEELDMKPWRKNSESLVACNTSGKSIENFPQFSLLICDICEHGMIMSFLPQIKATKERIGIRTRIKRPRREFNFYKSQKS